MSYLHENLTGRIIKAYYNVYNKMGFGFLEGVYEKAMLLELRKMGIKAKSQVPIKVHYDGAEVGNFFADILVEDSVILELKAVAELTKAHEAQLYNYLKATKIEIGLLLNFGITPDITRKIFDNEHH